MRLASASARAWVATLAAGLVIATGCVPQHVQIVMPPRDASMAERVAAYNAYRPTSTLTLISNGSKSQSIRLGNGQYLSEVDDLLPAVEATSPTAVQIERAHDYELPSNLLVATGALSTLGYFASVFAYGFTETSTYVKPLPLTLLAVTLTTLVVNGLVFAPVVSDARTKAFDTYDRDLLDRLHIQRKARVEDLAGQ